MSSSSSSETGLKSDKEKKWEQVQIKAFKAWINGYLDKKGMIINDINEDLKDGVFLLTFLEMATQRKIHKRWTAKPTMRVHKLENVSIALEFIQKELGVRLVGIGSEDVVDGQMKLTLGLLWSLFRRLRIETIRSEEGHSSEDALLSWLRKMTEEYPHVKISSFKESFNDGMAFSALIHKMNPDLIDFNDLDPANAEANLNHAFEIAETRLGIPKLLDTEDLLSGNPDERSVILYTSLFFHAFVADEERRKQAGKERVIVDKMSELQTTLEQSKEENTQLQEKNRELAEAQNALSARLGEKEKDITNLEGKIQQLTDEISYLRERAIKDAEIRALLSDKISVLESLLGEQAENSNKSDDERKKLLSELEEIRSKDHELNAELQHLEEEREKLLTDSEEKARRLAEMEARKSKLLEEIKQLQERVKQEIEDRKAKTAEIIRLRKEIEVFEKRQIVHTKARVGLDVLKHNLEAHLEDLYRWRDLNEAEFKDDVEEFDLSRVIADISLKGFEEQLSYLDAKLEEENRSLRRVIRLKDSESQLKDTVLKAGWLTMKGRKEWKRRWFKLQGSRLSYFEDEDSTEVAGCIQLDQGCDVVRQKAVKEDEASAKKAWPLKITVGDRKLFVRATTKKERHSWFLVLTSKIAHLNYINACESANIRPDTRLFALFASEKSTSLVLDNRPLTDSAVQALLKGLPGRDEIEALSLANAGVTDAQLEQLTSVLEKLTIKNFNLSGNNLTSASANHIISLLGPQVVELNLSKNQIDDAGVSQLVKALAGKENLAIVNLSGNKIGDEGAKAIAEGLSAEGLNVPHLELGNNQIGNDGAAALGKFLESNKSVSKVYLNNNQIGDVGAAAIAAGITNNGKVSVLDLSNNKIGAAGALAIRELLASNRELAEVSLSGNHGLHTGATVSALATAEGYNFNQLVFTRVGA